MTLCKQLDTLIVSGVSGHELVKFVKVKARETLGAPIVELKVDEKDRMDKKDEEFEWLGKHVESLSFIGFDDNVTPLDSDEEQDNDVSGHPEKLCIYDAFHNKPEIMGRSAKVHKRIKKTKSSTSTSSSSTSKPTSTPTPTPAPNPPIPSSTSSAQHQNPSTKRRTKLKSKAAIAAGPGARSKRPEGGHVLGGADYVELMMGSRRRAREEAAKLFPPS
ncbi:hypothetical protein ACEPAF_9557 [Sanghuangporus sanghuang]